MEDRPVQDHEEEEDPRGTFVILLFYLVLVMALWGFVYYTLLDRR